MGNRKHERGIFEALLGVAPRFLGDGLAEWSQPPDESDFPDVTGTTVSQSRVGIELGEWLNEREMAAATSTERAEAAMLTAVGPQRPNATQHVGHVWLSRKPGVRVRAEDGNQLSAQLYACIEECDSDDTLWDSPAGHFVSVDELAAFPPLAKYLQRLTLHRRRPDERWPSGVDWIGFPCRGGAYSADTMLEPLIRVLTLKRGHYAQSRLGFDHLSLVLFYDRALLYNSPVETLAFTFEDAARIAGDVISSNAGPFDSVFVFDATTKRLFKICPKTL